MKYYTFFSENNKFDELLDDTNIKPFIKTKIKWKNHLMLGLSENKDKSENIFGYIVLRYGDNIVNPFAKDYTPIPNVDYIPIRRESV